jgi:hypothetical protein
MSEGAGVLLADGRFCSSSRKADRVLPLARRDAGPRCSHGRRFPASSRPRFGCRGARESGTPGAPACRPGSGSRLHGEDNSWWFFATLEEGDEHERLRVRVTDCAAVSAGLGDGGPPPEWVCAALLQHLTTLHMSTPGPPALHALPRPLYLASDPADGAKSLTGEVQSSKRYKLARTRVRRRQRVVGFRPRHARR